MFHCIVPPNISAVNTNYTAVVGSQVTMECIITALGTPTATFGWNKNGYEVSHNTTISSSSLVLTLKNVTIEDNGVYNCIARNVLTYRYDHIELTVTQPIPIEGKVALLLLLLLLSIFPKMGDTKG